MPVTTLFSTSPDGTRIAYDITGEGPVLLLLHGAGKTRRDWHKRGYVERLKRDFTVITVDIRGTGESDYLTDIGDYAIDSICQDLLTVADACAVQQFAIWGYSFGGNIARYLGTRSERVTAIAVIGVPFGPAVDEAFDRFIDEYVQKWEPRVRADTEGTWSQGKRSPIKGHIPVFLACFQAMRRWPSVEPGDVGCPTLLLVGTKNQNVMNWITTEKEALVAARVQVETVEGLTHPQEFSQVDRVFPVVNAFLKEAELRSTRRDHLQERTGAVT
jgi:pimeloyl-ACP methyl ester carboxylesterase